MKVELNRNVGLTKSSYLCTHILTLFNLKKRIMRSNISDYDAVVEAATKFTRSVAEGNSKYAKELFTEDACLFGLDRQHWSVLSQC